MMKTVSNITAYLTHPLLWPGYMILLMKYFNPYAFHAVDKKMLLSFLANTMYYPIICLLLMRAIGLISDFKMQTQKERIIPFIAIMIFYIWSYKVIRDYQLVNPEGSFPMVMSIFMLGTLISVFLAFFINNFYKLSLHMVGMGGMLLTIIFQSIYAPTNLNYILLLFVMLTGFVATTRLYLNAHTLMQVYTGFLVGLIGQITGIFFFLQTAFK
ncbi:MAG: hypothetical protein K1X55_00920 [Chitinophagales bacterium]|nr:hypothetical protein [Chitinophagales bacterium]